MGEDIYAKIFSKNLRKYMEKFDKTQTDLINDLGFTRSAVSTWVNGTRLPRADKVEMLAQYFHIKRSDLTEDKALQVATDMSYFAELEPIFSQLPNHLKQDVINYARFRLDTYTKENNKS